MCRGVAGAGGRSIFQQREWVLVGNRMSYQVLARKWRPRNFSQMVGQEHVLQALINALDRDQLHHAYLFTGTRGVGKTTIARIFAKSLNCETNGVTSTPCGECDACREIDEGRFVDLIEVDAASRTKVDETRELLDNVQYMPTKGRYKVYLIDEVHMFSNHSFNALLKTLEEPPPHVKFLLATTDPQKLPVTIRSRCLQFNLKRISEERIESYLAELMDKESVAMEGAALAPIARAAEGSMRDALSLLDQAIAFGGGTLREAEVATMLGTIEHRQLLRIVEALSGNDGEMLLQQVEELAEQAVDFTAVLVELIAQLHQMALIQMVPSVATDRGVDAEWVELANQVSPEDLQLFYQIALTGRKDMPMAANPRSGLEMVLLRMLAFRPATGAAGGGDVAGGKSQQSAVTKGSAKGQSSVKATVPAATTAEVAVRDTAPAAEETQPAIALSADGWEQVVKDIGVKGAAGQLVRNSLFKEQVGGKIVLEIPERSEMFLNDERREQIRSALSLYMKSDIRLSINVNSGDLTDTPAMRAEQREEFARSEAAEVIQQDEDFQSLQSVFDGSIVEDSNTNQ